MDVVLDGVFEFGDAVHCEPLELALGELTEEALHKVEPRGGRGNEMEVDG